MSRKATKEYPGDVVNLAREIGCTDSESCLFCWGPTDCGRCLENSLDVWRFVLAVLEKDARVAAALSVDAKELIETKRKQLGIM